MSSPDNQPSHQGAIALGLNVVAGGLVLGLDRAVDWDNLATLVWYLSLGMLVIALCDLLRFLVVAQRRDLDQNALLLGLSLHGARVVLVVLVALLEQTTTDEGYFLLSAVAVATIILAFFHASNLVPSTWSATRRVARTGWRMMCSIGRWLQGIFVPVFAILVVIVVVAIVSTNLPEKGEPPPEDATHHPTESSAQASHSAPEAEADEDPSRLDIVAGGGSAAKPTATPEPTYDSECGADSIEPGAGLEPSRAIAAREKFRQYGAKVMGCALEEMNCESRVQSQRVCWQEFSLGSFLVWADACGAPEPVLPPASREYADMPGAAACGRVQIASGSYQYIFSDDAMRFVLSSDRQNYVTIRDADALAYFWRVEDVGFALPDGPPKPDGDNLVWSFTTVDGSNETFIVVDNPSDVASFANGGQVDFDRSAIPAPAYLQFLIHG